MKNSALALLLAFACCAECFAGTSGGMSGYVRNWHGQPVAHALITAVSPSQTCTTQTDTHGFFVCLTLPPGLYLVSAKKPGTSNAFGFNIRINSDQTTFLIFRFRSYRYCPAYVSSPLAADPFTSLDVKLMGEYPPNVAPPIALTPIYLRPPDCLYLNRKPQ